MSELFDAIDLVCAMYNDDEMEISEHDRLAIEQHDLQRPISIRLSLDTSQTHPLQVDLVFESDAPLVICLSQPSWLSRSQYDALLHSMPTSDQYPEDPSSYIVTSLEQIAQYCATVVISIVVNIPTPTGGSQMIASSKVLRTWHLLPSLSTKEKRLDMVRYAQSCRPPMTGIVLAGKPGLVILEHPSSATIDAYWSDIKSKSWADIPSSHKKVSERLRETDVERAFEEMREMTRDAELGGMEAMSGMRGNRNDMGFLEVWLEKVGLGGRLQRVLGSEW